MADQEVNPEYDPVLMAEVIQEGMDRAEAAAPEDWSDRAYAVVKALGEAGEPFTADDVWLYLGEDKPDNGSSLGPVIKQVAKDGFIKPYEDEPFRRSKRVKTHGKPLPVWIKA